MPCLVTCCLEWCWGPEDELEKFWCGKLWSVHVVVIKSEYSRGTRRVATFTGSFNGISSDKMGC